MPPVRAMGIDSLVIGAVEAASKPGDVDAPIGEPSCRLLAVTPRAPKHENKPSKY